MDSKSKEKHSIVSEAISSIGIFLSEETYNKVNAILNKDEFSDNDIFNISNYLKVSLEEEYTSTYKNLIEMTIDICYSLLNSNNHLIATHNGRMRCMLNDILNQANTPLDKKLRFKNCCILKLSFNSELNSSLNLIYSGEINTKKKYTYYVANPSEVNSNCVLFPNFNFTREQTIRILNTLHIKPSDINSEVNFFIVRHGEGFHNVSSFGEKAIGAITGEIYDALLTKDGILQGYDAGRFLENYLSKNNLYLKYLFSSDLKRTRQTINYILEAMNERRVLLNKIVVLPCSHELNFKNSSCDLKQSSFIPPENDMTCSISKQTDVCEDLCCVLHDNKGDILPVVWSYYLDFYGGYERGFKSGILKKVSNNIGQCRNTSMISIAFCIINEFNGVNEWINLRI